MPTPEHGEQAGYLLVSEPQDPHTWSQAATGVEPGWIHYRGQPEVFGGIAYLFRYQRFFSRKAWEG